MTKNVLIAGATGMMGKKLAREVLARGGRARLMVREDKSDPKISALGSLLAQGAEIVTGDVTKPQTLAAAMGGVDVIVSALQGGPDVIVDGQRALAEAGKAAGVQRIFPSDFSVDFREIPLEDHIWLAYRKRGDAAILKTGLPQTNTFNGAFTEMLLEPFLGMIAWDEAEVRFWGDADQLYDFTTTDDTARFVAAAALDDQTPDGGFEIIGEEASPRRLGQIASDVTGRQFALAYQGDLGQLNAEITRLQAVSPDDPLQWAGLQYARAMASGRGKLHHPANARYNDIKPRNIASFLREALAARGTS